MNGDGVPDLAVGANDYDGTYPGARGASYLVLGPVLAVASLADADAKLTGEAPGDGTGYDVVMGGDMNGDGLGDLLVSSQVAFYVVHGGRFGTWSLSEAEGKIEDADGGIEAIGLSGGGDFDGDGVPDVAAAGGGELSDGWLDGVAYVLRGPVSGATSLDDAYVKLVADPAVHGTKELPAMDVDLTGDLDADGRADLVVSTALSNLGEPLAGLTFVVLAADY
jgi:hypothetical protein